MVYPCKPQFCYIKVGFKGVNITWTCFPDVSVTPVGDAATFQTLIRYLRYIFIIPLNRCCGNNFLLHSRFLQAITGGLNKPKQVANTCLISVPTLEMKCYLVWSGQTIEINQISKVYSCHRYSPSCKDHQFLRKYFKTSAWPSNLLNNELE